MMRALRRLSVLIFCVCMALQARAQFISVGGGGLFAPDLTAAAPPGRVGGPASLESGKSGIIAVDAGIGFFPFLSGGLHYSYAKPEVLLRRGDAFGSSARMDLTAHTLTFDIRLRTPQAFGFRLYGLAGAGMSRFGLDVKQQVEIPFPRGIPDNLVAPVFTFGGGVEQSVFPLVHLKLEARDYLTPIPKRIYEPGGRWQRVAVIGGIVLGR